MKTVTVILLVILALIFNSEVLSVALLTIGVVYGVFKLLVAMEGY